MVGATPRLAIPKRFAFFFVAAPLALGQGGAAPPLAEVPPTQVSIRDEFWAPRREVNRRVSLPHSLDALEKEGALRNLARAAKGERGKPEALVYTDSDLWKTLEAIALTLGTDPDPALERRFDGIVAQMAKAQQPDGYLNTWFQVGEPPERRFQNLRDQHELYCAGHLFEAAVAHFRATGKRTLLEIATKYADLLCRTFGDGPGQRPGYCGHPEIELALVKLWRATGEKRYFDLAAHFLDTRGSHFFAKEHGTPEERYDGSYWLDHVRVRDLRSVAGHAVRAAYLLCGAADVAGVRGDPALEKAVRRVWRNTTERNVFVTGGVGPSAHNEGFTEDYDLPTLSAYQETCASVAMALWNQRLALAERDAKYADGVETALYNGMLAGVSLTGDRFFYVNPLESRGDHHRSPWFACACCPPNVTRTLAGLGGDLCAVGDGGLWVNQYVAGTIRAEVDGRPFELDVETRYPWEGNVRVVARPAAETKATLRFRVPGWCRGASISVKGGGFATPDPERGYFVVEGAWKAGDAVDLDFPMPVRRLEAHPLAKDLRGRVALARGPIVYCFEQCDQEAPLDETFLSPSAPFEAVARPGVLGGIVALEGRGLAAAPRPFGRELYREAPVPKETRLVAVPYYAWDQRAPGAMKVWMATAPPAAAAGGPERRARVAISFRNWNCDPEGARDGVEPKKSSEQPARACHFWDHKGTTEWVEYSWDTPVEAAACEVYWFDDTGRGECRLPKSWRILWRDGDAWKPVALEGNDPVALDRFCEARFAPVRTSALRLEVTLQPGWSAGLHEWRVVEADPDR